MNDVNQGVTDIENYEKIYDVIAGKEFKNSKVIIIIVSVFFVIALLLKIFVSNLNYEQVWLNLVWVLAVATETTAVALFIWMFWQKKKFLSSSKIEEYAVEIAKHIVKATPTEIVTKKYVFKRRTPAAPIDFSLVAWIYRNKVIVGKQKSDTIVFKLQNGKKQEMIRRVSFTESDLYHLVSEVNSDVIIGNSIDNYKRYKEIVKNRK